MFRDYPASFLFMQQVMILVTDAVLLNLYNVFGGVFERALELYEQGRVTHIFPSETIAATSHSDKSNARYLVQVRGISGEIYTFFPDINYCTCASFRYKIFKSSCGNHFSK